MPMSRQILKEKSFQPRECSQRRKEHAHFSNYSADIQKIIMNINDPKKVQNDCIDRDSKSRRTYDKVLGKTPESVMGFCYEKSPTNIKTSIDNKNFFDNGERINYRNHKSRNDEESEREFQFDGNKLNSNITNEGLEQRPRDPDLSKPQLSNIPTLDDLSVNDPLKHSFQKYRSAIKENASGKYLNDKTFQLNDEYDYNDKGKHISTNNKNSRRREIKKKVSRKYCRSKNEFVDGLTNDWDKITQVKFSCHEKGTDEQLRNDLKNLAQSLKDPLLTQARDPIRKQTEHNSYDNCINEKSSQDKGQYANFPSSERDQNVNFANKNETLENKYKHLVSVQDTHRDTDLDDPLKTELKKFAKSLKDPFMEQRSSAQAKCRYVGDIGKGKPSPTIKRIPSRDPGHVIQELSDSVHRNVNFNVHGRFLDDVDQHDHLNESERIQPETSSHEDEKLKTELLNFAKSINDRYIKGHSKHAAGPLKNRKIILPCNNFLSSFKDINLTSANGPTADTSIFQRNDAFLSKTSRHIPYKEQKETNGLKSDENLKADLRNFIKEICPNKIDSTKGKHNRHTFVSHKDQEGAIHHYAGAETGDTSTINSKTNNLKRRDVCCFFNEINSTRTLDSTNDQSKQLPANGIQTGCNFNQTNGKNNFRSRRHRTKHSLKNFGNFSDEATVKMCAEEGFSFPKDEFALYQSVNQTKTGVEQLRETQSTHFKELGGMFEDECESGLLRVGAKSKRNGKMSNSAERNHNKNDENVSVLKFIKNTEKLTINDKLDNGVSTKELNQNTAVSANLVARTPSISSSTLLKFKNNTKDEMTVKEKNNFDSVGIKYENDSSEFLPKTPRTANYGRRSLKINSTAKSSDNREENSLVTDDFHSNPTKYYHNTEERIKKSQECQRESNNITDDKLNPKNEFLPETPRTAKHDRRSLKINSSTKSADGREENPLISEEFPESPSTNSHSTEKRNTNSQECQRESNNIIDNKLNSKNEFVPETTKTAKHGRKSLKINAVKSAFNREENSYATDDFQAKTTKNCHYTEKQSKKSQENQRESNNITDSKLNPNEEILLKSKECSITKKNDIENNGINTEHEINSKIESTNNGQGGGQNSGNIHSRETCAQILEEPQEEHSKSTISAFLDSQQYSDSDKREEIQESLSDKVHRWEKGCSQHEKANSVASSKSSKELLKKFNLGNAMASTIYGSPAKKRDSSQKQSHDSNQPTNDVTFTNKNHRRKQWEKLSSNEQNMYKQNSLEGLDDQLSSHSERQGQQIFLDGKDLGQKLNYVNNIQNMKQENIRMLSGSLQTNLNQMLNSSNQTGFTGDMLKFNVQHSTFDSSGNFSNMYSKFPVVLNYINRIGLMDQNGFVSYIECDSAIDTQNNKTGNFESGNTNNTHIQETKSNVSNFNPNPGNPSELQPKQAQQQNKSSEMTLTNGDHPKFKDSDPLNPVNGNENGCHLFKTDNNIDQNRYVQMNVDGILRPVQISKITSQNTSIYDASFCLNQDPPDKGNCNSNAKDQINQSRNVIRDKIISGRDMASLMYGENWESKPSKMGTTNGQTFLCSPAMRNDQNTSKNDKFGSAVDSSNNEFPSAATTTATKAKNKDAARKPQGIVPGLE